MLCAIQKCTGLKVVALSAEKADGPYLCPKCRVELNLKKGQIKAHHFAHKPPVTCTYSKGESEAHRKAKLSIFEALSRNPNVTDCELEKYWGDVVSDVYANINGVPTAMEVQISTLSMSEITRRTEEYFKRGIAVLWLPLFSDGLSEEKYSPRVWEKWLHATYFGRVYYWLADLSVIPVHFGEYKLRVEESHWHDEYGDEQWAPGYERISKKWKSPMLGNQVNIVHDFAVRRRTAWQGGKMIVPASRLLLDSQRAWWK